MQRLLAASWLVLAACAAPLERVERARPAMGTEFRVVLYAADPARGAAAAEAALARVAALDRALSDYDPGSELSALGLRSDGRLPSEWVALSPELYEVLAAGEEIARASGGAFDVTVGPFSRLWRRARRRQELPEPAALDAAAPAVGIEKLELDHAAGRARLHARGMRLDLGGIAKGYALDEALRVLAERGFARALVVGGGEMLAGEPPPGERGWRVTLVGLGTPPESLYLARRALATSGDLEQALVLGAERHSHILDPRTGRALTERRLVSVLGPSAMLADALATALSVLGPDEGLALAARHPGVELRRLARDGERIEDLRTPGFPRGLSCAGSSALPDP